MKLTDEEILQALKTGCGVKRKNWSLMGELNYDCDLGFEIGHKIMIEDLSADDWEVSDWTKWGDENDLRRSVC